jgi:hypothetical protein
MRADLFMGHTAAKLVDNAIVRDSLIDHLSGKNN